MTKTRNRQQGAQPKFTEANDKKLEKLVQQYGTSDWDKIARLFSNKSAKQCRDRWMNYLNPEFRHGKWTAAEDRLLLKYHDEIGSQWTQMSKMFEKRMSNDLRFRFLKLKRRQTRNPEEFENYMKQDVEEIATITESKEEDNFVQSLFDTKEVSFCHDLFSGVTSKFDLGAESMGMCSFDWDLF